jgi:hypothetical protein
MDSNGKEKMERKGKKRKGMDMNSNERKGMGRIGMDRKEKGCNR